MELTFRTYRKDVEGGVDKLMDKIEWIPFQNVVSLLPNSEPMVISSRFLYSM